MIVGFNMALSLSHCVKSQLFSLFVSLSLIIVVFSLNRIIAMCGDYYIGGRRFSSLSDLIGYYSYVSCLLKGEKLESPVAPPEVRLTPWLEVYSTFQRFNFQRSTTAYLKFTILQFYIILDSFHCLYDMTLLDICSFPLVVDFPKKNKTLWNTPCVNIIRHVDEWYQVWAEIM